MEKKYRKSLVEKLENIIVRSCNNNIFSAASIAYSHGKKGCFKTGIISSGISADKGGSVISDCFMFDLASLTKPLVTLLSILTLIEKKELSWKTTIGDIFFDCPEQSSSIDIYNILCHCSGLPAHREYWHELKFIEDSKKNEWVRKQIFLELNELRSVGYPCYSDLGYLLLGFIVEKISKVNLNCFWENEISRPLCLENELHFCVPTPDKREQYVMTGVGSWDHIHLQGIVNDDNCRALGGVSGHAGLFGTSRGVLKLCQELLSLLSGSENNRLPFSKETLSYACRRVGKTEWTAGFNLPSPGFSSSGKYFSEKSIGHLGFTGTSFWIDPDKDIIVVLLTNRVVKGKSLIGIRTLRPFIHDVIIEHLCMDKK